MRNKRDLIILLVVLLFAIAAFFFFDFKSRNPSKICFGNNCFYVEIAGTTKEKEQGLMFREALPSNAGMLFVFNDEGIYPFWMKNTFIPLDILWLSKTKEVVFISKNAKPCKNESCPLIFPDKKAKYVLEINGGISDKLNLKIGSQAGFLYN
jgi:uncharacterized membrane protein (UPF0127 family)